MYATCILHLEVINYGSKKESKGYEEEGLRKQEDKSQEEEVLNLLLQNTQIQFRGF